MIGWRDRRVLDLFGIETPIIQAPMAGASTVDMAVSVSLAGGLGSLACAMLDPAAIRRAIADFRARSTGPINANFFCHQHAESDPARHARWRARLAGYYDEAGLARDATVPPTRRVPFDPSFCDVVEDTKPEIVSFHFGLPATDLLARVKASGARVIGSATCVAEAQYLEDHGCDAIIAMGVEAGGHRGNFLVHDMASQIGLFALVPQVVDAVRVPVIAAGGIADGRGVAAALMLGASAVQIGTAYLLTPQAAIAPAHRRALRQVRDDGTAVTNLFTGRPARGIFSRLMRECGPLNQDVPAFPEAADALAPLREATQHSADFITMWAGQGAAMTRERPCGELTRIWAEDARARLAT